MQNRQPTDLVLQALLMAVWRRKPKATVLMHSDQGSQFTSIDWATLLKHHNLEHSMSRRGNCHDNAVAESFFNLLKREQIRRRTYKTRDAARLTVPDEEMARLGSEVIPLPGMPVDVLIQTSSRTMLSYFVKPISDHIARAFIEE